MSCGNGCGCCPKCGCHRQCTCNRKYSVDGPQKSSLSMYGFECRLLLRFLDEIDRFFS